MKQSTLYRNTIALLLCVLTIAACTIHSLKVNLDGQRLMRKHDALRTADYLNRLRHEQMVNAQLRHTNKLMDKWLVDQSVRLEKYEGNRAWVRHADGTVTNYDK